MLRTTLASLALTASLPAATQIFQSFEGDGFDAWKIEGTAFGLGPAAEKTLEMTGPLTGFSDDRLAISAHGGDLSTGSMTSPEFTINEPYITFLIAGGDYKGTTAAQLLIDGKVVREANGKRSLRCESALWDVTEFKGKKAVIKLVDEESGSWGFVAVDHIIFTSYPNQKFPPTTKSGKAHIDGLAPTSAVAGANIPIDATLKVEATYKDLQINSPTALTFDDQGRVYVSETHRFRSGIEDDRDHLYWYLDDLASKKTSDRRALHEKWKEKVSIAHLTEKSEVIRRLADTNGDGVLDESKVFAENFKDVLDGTAAGVFYYEGALYFSCIPKIWMLRDANGDGVDDERKVVEEGFGVRISLSGHDLNGFALGPDGRIYGTIGDRGLSLVTKEGVPYDYPDEGVAFSFEPDGTDFQIFHTGLRNPKEIAFDALGNAFSVDNNSDQGDAARVVYLVEGGDSGWQMEHQAMHTFHRQIGLENRPPSRWMDEKMWEMENPVQPSYMLPPSAHLTSGPSGLTIHPGTGFLESEAGRFLVCDYRGGSANSGIWSFEMLQKGAGMKMTEPRQFAWGIAATDVEYSWDGRVFISDFITGWAAHDDGRLLSLSAGEKTWKAAEAASTAQIISQGFAQRSSAELAELMGHADARVRLRAQIALTRKPDALSQFSAGVSSTNFMARVHSIWGLGILTRRGATPLPYQQSANVVSADLRTEAESKLISLLKDENAEIRSQALRALATARSSKTPIQLGPLLTDESPRVRFFAAILAGNRKLGEYFGPICEMLKENNNSDVYLRHAGIYALQNIAPDAAAVRALTTHDSAAVRLAATVALRRMKSPEIAAFIRDADPKVADEAIRAICDTDMVGQRPAVAELLDQPESREWTPFMLRRLLHNSFRIGTAENAARVLKFAANAKNPEKVRQEALRLVSIWAEPLPADQLTGHYRPLDKRDPETIRPALTSILPELIRQDGFALVSALGLVGKYNVTIAGLDDATLNALIRNDKLPAAARANALDLYIARKPGSLTEFLVQTAKDDTEEVSLTALTSLAKLAPEAALAPLEAATRSKKPSLVQKVWQILATLPGDPVDAIFTSNLDSLRAANGISPHAIELVAAAKERKGTNVTAALAALEKSLAENSDPLAKWNLALEGGDAESGAAIFTSHPASECMRCHRAEEGHAAGGETAPNLFGIAKRHKDRRYFLESMVKPSDVIAPGFGTVLIDFKNGASLSGNLIAEAPDHLDLDASGKNLRIKRDDIASFTPPVSPMPPMADLLNMNELRDLVAWLSSLDKGGNKTQAVAVPTPLDPNTLEIPKKSSTAAAVDPAFLKTGQQQFIVCGACHGQSGEGTAVAPPLAGSEWVNGPVENLIRIQLRGLKGPIKVKGQEYNMPAGMAPLAYQTDEQIAAVLTYVRTGFGNSASAVSAKEVTALRSEVGKPQLGSADLLPPVTETAPSKQQESTTPGKSVETKPESAKTGSGKYDQLAPPSGINKWAALFIGVIFVTCVAPFLRRS